MKLESTDKGRLRLNECMPIICTFFAVTPQELLSKSRLRKVVNARHSLRYFMSFTGDLTLGEIGTLTNGDHSSVSHSIKMFNIFKDQETKFNEFYKYITRDKNYTSKMSLYKLDKQLRKTDSYRNLTLGGKIDFIKNFIEWKVTTTNGYK